MSPEQYMKKVQDMMERHSEELHDLEDEINENLCSDGWTFMLDERDGMHILHRTNPENGHRECISPWTGERVQRES